MKYLAHVDGDREQSVKEHLAGTAQLAEIFAEKFGNGDWGYCCGLLHDIGKYSDRFQRKIQGEPELYVDHSTAGGGVIITFFVLDSILISVSSAFSSTDKWLYETVH